MTKRLAAPILLAILLAAAAVPARAQEDGFEFRFSNFSLEFFGGLSGFKADTFNGYADYEQAWLQFHFARQFDYLHAANGDAFSYSSRVTAGSTFQKITRATPYGARIRYQASPTFSLTVGLEILDGRQTSNVGMAFDVSDLRPSAPAGAASATYQYLNPGFEMRVRAWRPTFGAHFGWDLAKFLRSEIFIDFGPLFTETTAVSDRRLSYTEASGYHWESASKTTMKGTSTALCGELGTALHVRLTGFLQLTLEGSYAFRQPGQVEGPGTAAVSSADSLGVQTGQTSSWNGLWSFLTSNESAAWGRFTYLSLQNRVQFEYGVGAQRFALDLSGIQMKAGLKVNF